MAFLYLQTILGFTSDRFKKQKTLRLSLQVPSTSPLFRTVWQWVQCSSVGLVTHNIKIIRGAAHKTVALTERLNLFYPLHNEGFIWQVYIIRWNLSKLLENVVLHCSGSVRQVLYVTMTTSTCCYIITGRNEVVAKVIFLHLFVILFTGGMVVSHKALRQTPPGPDTPPPPPPRTRHTHPPDQMPPWTRHTTPPDQTPPREADSGIRSTSGRYASYCNAFLLYVLLCDMLLQTDRVYRCEIVMATSSHRVRLLDYQCTEQYS